MIAVLLAISFCCPILFAIDDEDNDLPPIILPRDGNGGGGGNGNGSGCQGPPFSIHGDQGSQGLDDCIAVVIDAQARLVTVPDSDQVPGVWFSPRNNGVNLLLVEAGSPMEPQNPNSKMLVTSPSGDRLNVIVDDDSFVIGNHYVVTVTVADLFKNLAQMDVNSGTETGLTCLMLGGLDNVSATELSTVARKGGGKLRCLIANNGRFDFTDLVERIEDHLMRYSLDRLGVVHVGYNAQGAPVSLTSIVIDVDENAIAYGFENCYAMIEVFTRGHNTH